MSMRMHASMPWAHDLSLVHISRLGDLVGLWPSRRKSLQRADALLQSLHHSPIHLALFALTGKLWQDGKMIFRVSPRVKMVLKWSWKIWNILKCICKCRTLSSPCTRFSSSATSWESVITQLIANHLPCEGGTHEQAWHQTHSIT